MALALAMAGALVLVFSSLASAAETRDYLSRITGVPSGPGVGASGPFSYLVGVSVDGADNVWVGDSANGVVDKFDPSGNFLLQGTGPYGSSFAMQDIAYGRTVNQLYVAGYQQLWLVEPDGSFTGTTYTSNLPGQSLNLAIDNSGTSTDSYLYLTPNPITRVDAAANPVNFPFSASYISDNQLTGTGQPFGSLYGQGLAVDGSGDLYLADPDLDKVHRFHSTGEFVDSYDGQFNGYASVAIDSTNGHLLVAGGGTVHEFDSAGNLLYSFDGRDTPPGSFDATGVAVDSTGKVYIADLSNGVVNAFGPSYIVPDVELGSASGIGPNTATLSGEVGPGGGPDVETCSFEYVKEAAFQKNGFAGAASAPCVPAAPYAAATPVSVSLTTLSAETKYRYRVVAANEDGANRSEAQTFTTPIAVNGVDTAAATDVTNASATLHGSFTGDGVNDTSFYFQYGTDTTYGEVSATPPGTSVGSGAGTQLVSQSISGLQPGAIYHYRTVATNKYGPSFGPDRTFKTLRRPSINAFSASDVTATSAILRARINPEGGETTYHFEYGPTESYGQVGPEEGIGSGIVDQSVSLQLSDLQPGAAYHFRVVATSPYGTTVSGDQTFSFFTPNCPNAHVRQTTSSSTLPDCRAYELVSPAEAGGTTLFPASGPNTGLATSPARLAFTGNYGVMPGVGNPSNILGDLYVATRTNTGWGTKFIGLPGDQRPVMAGPPATSGYYPDEIHLGVLTDRDMSRFLVWDNGAISVLQPGPQPTSSNAPYVWGADGSQLGRWPTNLGSVGGGTDPLECSGGSCPGHVAASADLTHFVFSANNKAFSDGGLESAPGSVYDNETDDQTIAVASKTPAGDDIPLQPGSQSDDVLKIPDVSTDGSHILIAADYSGPCDSDFSCPTHLYMRVNGAVTFDISGTTPVQYVGMTEDGSNVYFTSSHPITADDHDESADLFMWDESSKTITRISVGKANRGDTDDCSASWTSGCGIVTYSAEGYSELVAGGGGNGTSDNSIASESGDIYFYSPEQLDGTQGENGQQNLYVYRNGDVQFVTTLDHEDVICSQGSEPICSDGPVVRLQVSPDGENMSFVTASRVTSYDNDGRLVMYTYRPSVGIVTCVSCIPSGAAPTTDVRASQNGLFMTDDGRSFFSTNDALVPQDTNSAFDVYEFAEGRPQLITTGTGSTKVPKVTFDTGAGVFGSRPGFIGVSADGTDAYFAVYDSLVAQDRNGNQLKIYDARTGGGFAVDVPLAPCVAADECHGAGSLAPTRPTSGTGGALGSGGNLAASTAKAKKRRKSAKRRRPAAKRRSHGKRAGKGSRGGAK